MLGYYRNEGATAAALRSGWLATGDLGRMDENGNLYIVGRAEGAHHPERLSTYIRWKSKRCFCFIPELLRSRLWAEKFLETRPVLRATRAGRFVGCC